MRRTKEKSTSVSSIKSEEQKMLIDNEIPVLISEIRLLPPDDKK